MKRIVCAAAAALCLVAAAAAPAAAQGTTTIVSGSAIFDTIKPFLDTAVYILSAVVMTVGAAWLKSRWNIDVEKDRRDALQAALLNGGGLILAQLGERAKTQQIDVRSPLVKAGVDYVMRSAPEAAEHFKLSRDAIAEKLVAKVGLVTAPNTAIDPAAKPPAG